ncbi:molecular chaperone HtpG [Lujinxingia litoralis]|uniref:Chaperone protein HtpG n=1 Tax=Lujinxingia litoralis TaxID=2211119 RepID=A0A328C4T3_9DELT|nr:molecular chaperone HtpG [Lujinxingia litoralis]RAL22331.1 molecular chaperone HtpG [Lujinxingia litoralis]
MSSQKETRAFEAEVSQVLRLMIHAMYSNKEVFLRELVSNASDAIDKLRFEALADPELRAEQGEAAIALSVDREARTLTIADTGIGMSRQEVTESIGTIARSGTREFLERLSGDQQADAQLIGQFGVGFYSAFIVAERVVLTTRRAGERDAVRWESTGDGEYTLEAAEKAQAGTEIVLHLREDEDEFLEPMRLETVVRRYSDHISFPIYLVEEASEEGQEPTRRQLNEASALWTRSASEISAEDYTEFYRHVARAFDEPLAHVHTTIEGRLKFTLLLYVPSARPFDFAMAGQERQGGVKLYVKRVFIMDEAEMFLPRYLRFVRGVVDSDDLPLNVSRELLQDNRVVRTMRQTAIKKVLERLETLSQDAEAYGTFWNAFGPILKEGVIEEPERKEQIAALLRFASTSPATEDAPEAQQVRLADYIERMRPGQEAIYYITADSYASALASPHLEIFKARGVEVLVLTDAVDEWLVNHLSEFQGKALRSVTRGALDLESLGKDAEAAEEESAVEDAAEEAEAASEAERAPWLGAVEELLGEQVREVRLSQRLTDSPSCLVREEWEIGERMRRILEQAGESVPASAPILELNEKHPLVARLAREESGERRTRLAELLLDQARLGEGGQLQAPALFVRRLNELLVELMDEA